MLDYTDVLEHLCEFMTAINKWTLRHTVFFNFFINELLHLYWKYNILTLIHIILFSTPLILTASTCQALTENNSDSKSSTVSSLTRNYSDPSETTEDTKTDKFRSNRNELNVS